jgi:uncharacterized membrane protein
VLERFHEQEPQGQVRMVTLRRYWLAILFTLAAFAVPAALYVRLPPQLPVHFNWEGAVDHWMPKAQGAFIIPVGAVLLLAVLIAIAPRAARGPDPDPMRQVYPQVVAAIAALMLYHTCLLIAIALGEPLEQPVYAFMGLGFLIMFLGNRFGRLTRNSVIGIRTPATLASDEVWARTHRLGGRLFVLAGLALWAAAALGHARLGLIPLCAAALISVLYAGHLGRRLGGGPGGSARL